MSVGNRPGGKKAENGDHTYDADHYFRCKLCHAWINGANPADIAAHRGPLPHPVEADAPDWPDDDDY
jgi:hypothetical protein